MTVPHENRVISYVSRGEKRWLKAEAQRKGLSISRLIKTWIIEKRAKK